MGYQLREATIDDMELLINLRITFLQTEFGVLKGNELEELKRNSKEYYQRTIPKGMFSAVLAQEDGQTVGCAYLAVSFRPPNEQCLNGRVGSILNVYVQEDYRHRGIATAMMQRLIANARSQNLSYLELSASVAGKPLYEKLGFAISGFPLMTMKIK